MTDRYMKCQLLFAHSINANLLSSAMGKQFQQLWAHNLIYYDSIWILMADLLAGNIHAENIHIKYKNSKVKNGTWEKRSENKWNKNKWK